MDFLDGQNQRVSNQNVKKINRLKTIRSILACERISQQELSKKLDISWPTVLQNVKELAELGLVQEVGTFASTGGRKARAFAPIRDAKLAVGLDITKNHFGLVLTNLAGELMQYKRQKLPFALEDKYFQTIAGEIDEFVRVAGYGMERVLGLGVALPGVVDNEAQKLAYSHTLGLRDVPLARFSEHLPCECVFINDANAAGFAELRGLGLIGDAVYLSVSDTVGGAFLRRGQLYAGDNLRAGEFGHMTLMPQGRECYCGKSGCVDAYCSTKTLAQSADMELKEFFAALQTGDTKLETIWAEYLGDLAITINNLRMAFDCDVIVGGYLGAYLEKYEEQLRETLSKRNTFEENADYFKICHYQFEAAALGASFLQIENFLQGI